MHTTLASRRTTALAVVLLTLVSACASEHWVYEKANVTPARLDQDLVACRKEAKTPTRLVLFQSDRVDQAVLNRCMQRRGYTPRRDS